MGGSRRAALAGMEERGQALEVDLQEVPRQDSGRSTHTFEHSTDQRRVGFLPQVNRRLLAVLLAEKWKLGWMMIALIHRSETDVYHVRNKSLFFVARRRKVSIRQ